MFCVCFFGFDWYLFQIIVFLKPDFNCWSNIALSWVDKVTAGPKRFVSVIVNLPSPVELVIRQVDDHIKKRLTSINQWQELKNCLNILMVQLF